MTATNYTFQCEQGATFLRTIIWKDENNQPINNSTYSASMEIRAGANQEPISTLSTANSKIELGGGNGAITMQLDALETSSFKQGDYFYDIQLQAADNSVTRVLEGIFSVKQEITR